MKRIVTFGAVVTAFAVAPALAAAGNNNPALANVSVAKAAIAKAQIAKTEVARTQVAKAHRVQAAVRVERHVVQVAQAQRSSLLRGHIR